MRWFGSAGATVQRARDYQHNPWKPDRAFRNVPDWSTFCELRNAGKAKACDKGGWKWSKSRRWGEGYPLLRMSVRLIKVTFESTPINRQHYQRSGAG